MAIIVKILMLIIIETVVHPDHLLTIAQVSTNNTAELDRIKAFKITEHIQNKTHRVLIMEQLVYCPSQHLCSIGSVNKKPNNFTCCTPCSCEDTCTISGSCCIDKALAEDSLDILSRKGSSCVLPQLKPFHENGLNTNDRFLMVGLCNSTFVDENITRKCQSGQGSPTGANVADYLPVSSVTTHGTYRNRYCAYCNWEHDSDLTYWETSFSCRGSEFVFPHKARELFSFIVKERECNLFYQPPRVALSFPCRDETYMYTECNVTGLWTEYDSSIDWACRHYQNAYGALSTYYKNVFCYICNTDSPVPLSCFPGYSSDVITGMTSFTALFNFIEDPPKVQTPETSHLCAGDFRFDTYRNICREITCLPPFVYSNDVCENVFSRIASQRYEMFLRFNKAPAYYTNCDICPQLAPRLIQEYVKVHLINMGYYKYACGLSVLHHNERCSEGITSTGTGYLILHVELNINDFHDPMDVAELFLNSSAFHLESTESDLLCIDLQPKVVGGNVYEFESDKNEYDYVSQLESEYIYPSSGEKMNVNTYSEVGICVFKPWVARLEPAFICPHVNISLSDYNVTIDSNSLCFDTPKTCFQPEEFIFVDNNSYAMICADKFFASHVLQYTTSRVEDLGKVLVSVVCSCLSVICLIVTMVTYMLFPILRTLPGLYTMALCATLIVAHVLFTFGAGAVKIGFLCEVFGIIIHLSMLASVFLMNVCSIHMFRVFNHLDRQYVLTEEEKRRHFLISLVYSYGSSVIFVLGRIAYSVVTTGMSGYGIRVCFINDQNALLFTFTLPVMLLVVANIVMFCIVIVKVSQLPDMSKSTSCRHHQKRFFIYIKLSSLTGVAWFFGFIAEISDLDVFVYLYIILIAGQGVFIMLSFVCNKRVYKLYIAYKKQVTSQTTLRSHTIVDTTLSNSSDFQYKRSNNEATTTTTTTTTGVEHDMCQLSAQDTSYHESSTKL